MAAHLSLSIVLFSHLLITVRSYGETVRLPRAQTGKAGHQSQSYPVSNLNPRSRVLQHYDVIDFFFFLHWKQRDQRQHTAAQSFDCQSQYVVQSVNGAKKPQST